MEALDIERSIIKKYRKTIWVKFVKSIKEYELIKNGDVIGICISGGKDSFLMAKCMQELKKHGKFDFELKFIVMNPGYTKEHLDKIVKNAEHLNIEVDIFNSDIFDVLKNNKSEFPCYMCARMRRGHLYNRALELGCNKIALGHHMDDVIETVLLNMFYNGTFSGMPPKLFSDNFKGMELIRPMYFIKENDIKSWANTSELTFLDCACSVTKKKYASKRREIKELISNLKKNNDNIDINIFRSLENVNLNTVNGYYKDKEYFSILDGYDKR
jgi:tRNA(Ile)-lysidine synthase TilS/MesJ